MSARSPRRQFLAPFLLTVAAAVPGCKPKGSDSSTITHHNPPADPYRSWSVWASDDGCEAAVDAEADCPPDADCNPPAPMRIACPEGMGEESVTIEQWNADGPCTLNGAEVACPEEVEEEEPMPEDDLTDA